MTGITPSQMRKIYALARNAGMDDDLLHIYVKNVTGKGSLRTLTVMEAVQVIDRMEGREQKRVSGGHMTQRQEAFLWQLVTELEWVDEEGKPDRERLNRFIKARFRADHYRFLSSCQAGKVIEALKAMRDRERRARVI